MSIVGQAIATDVIDTTEATPILLMSPGHKIPCACGIRAEDGRGIMLQQDLGDILTIATDEEIKNKINQGEIFLPVYRIDQIREVLADIKGFDLTKDEDYSTFVMIDSKIDLVIFNLAAGKLQIIKEYNTISG
jgi:hypothetical protein